MTNPATRSPPRAGLSSSSLNSSSNGRCSTDASATDQAKLAVPLDGDGIAVASFWKSPRNRREAIQVSLRSYEGHPYADFRVYAVNGAGRMVPTPRGIAVGLKTLPRFCEAAGDALRKATQLGLTAGSSS